MSTKTVTNTLSPTYYQSAVIAHNAVPGVSFTKATGANLSYSSTRTTSPDSIPDFRNRLRRGLPCTTDLTASRVSIRGGTHAIIDCLSTSTNSPGDQFREVVMGNSFLGFDLSVPTFGDELLRVRALQRFLSSYQDNITKFQGGVFLREIKETIGLIVRPAKIVRSRLDQYYQRAKKARAGFRNRVSKDLANEWLQYKFGVLPLLSDIEDGSKALADISANRRLQTRITGSAKNSWVTSRSAGSGGINTTVMDYWEVSEYSLQYKYYGSMWLDTGSPTHIISALGFSPANWLPTAWELIPYSFIIDYFTNIGDLLNSWSYGTMQLNWSNMTTRRTRKSTRRVIALRQTSPFWVHKSISNGNPTTVVTAANVSRAANPNLFLPFQIKFPGLGDAKWINLAALVAQRDRDKISRL